MTWKRIAAVIWALVILALCTTPAENLPHVPILSADKLAHFGIFAVLAWLWLWSSRSAVERVVPYVLGAGLAFAGLTELYQGLLPFGRQPSLFDFIANTAGLLAGVWLYRRWTAWRAQASDFRPRVW